MKEQCDLKVNINGQHTFFLSQSILCSFSGKLKELVKQENKKNKNKKNSNSADVAEVKMTEFPGGPTGFEMVSRFCHSSGGGGIPLSPSTVCLLHSSAAHLGIAHLVEEAEAFLDGLFYWTWDDVITSLRTCPSSSPLLGRLLPSLLSKIEAHSDSPIVSTIVASSPGTPRTPDSVRQSLAKDWWFDDLTTLPPPTIERILLAVGALGTDNRNLTLTRFLLHYLKRSKRHREACGALADTAVHGVVLVGRAAFSCRAMFWVLRVVSGFGLSRECRQGLERVIGLALDQATLDDLLVSGRGDGGVYDVNLVVRLVRVFVLEVEEGQVVSARMRKVGRLVDKYLREISPDPGLKVSRFLAVAESLPHSARECFDGVYRALDIYLESHPTLSSEDRATLCRCLNYEKLTFETCKDLAKNPRIPPGAAMQALVSQQSKLQIRSVDATDSADSAKTPRGATTSTTEDETDSVSTPSSDDKDELKLNLRKMQSRVKELEKVCFEMKSQMSNMVKGKPIVTPTGYQSRRGMSRFC